MKKIYLLILLFVWGCTPNPYSPEALRLANAWCDCVDEQRDTLTVQNIENIWKVCDERLMDSSNYFVYYYKNMGIFNGNLSMETLEMLEKQYGEFSDLRDQLCPVSRAGDSLIAPRNYRYK